MEGKASNRSSSQPESHNSAGSGNVDLAQFGVSTHSAQGHINPTHSIGGFF